MFPIIWCGDDNTTVKKPTEPELCLRDSSGDLWSPMEISPVEGTGGNASHLCRYPGLAQVLDKKETKPTYATIMNDVRNMRVLTSQQMICVRTLPKDKVLDLIEIYNQIMENVNEALLSL